MLEQAGAAEVVGIESNSNFYLKCLIVKELLQMRRTRFLFGDFLAYLRTTSERFDAVIACGVLYHLTNPQELFHLIAAHCDGPVLLWTQYWSPDIQRTHPTLFHRFGETRVVETGDGKRLELHRHEYRGQPSRKGFLGGIADYSEWLSRDSLFTAIESAGYAVKAIHNDEPEHVNGPAITLLLCKRDQA